jgi:diguanylate cyclase (GGDEF)-like protein
MSSGGSGVTKSHKVQSAHISTLLLVLVLLASAPLEASRLETPRVSVAELQAGYSLAGNWQFRWGDDLSWASPSFDDSSWEVHKVPQRWPKIGIPESQQFSWYRLTLQLDGFSTESRQAYTHVGIQIGKVLSAYELYAGGALVGGVGKLPPNSHVNYDQVRVYPVPLTAIAEDGSLVLALRVWGGSELAISKWGGGPHEGEFRIGTFDKLLSTSFLGEIASLILGAMFSGFGLYHIYIYLRNRQLRTYLWYGLTALDIGLYSFLSGQLRYNLNWPFYVYEKIEFGAIYILPALLIQMFWSLLGLRINRILRAYQFCFVALSLAALCIPGLSILYHTMLPQQVIALPLVFWIPWLIIRAALSGNREARTIMLGLVIFAACAGNDLMIDLAGWDTARMIPLGFIAIIVSMALSLANRFTTVLNNLEGEVAQQTADLRSANEQLATVARQDPLTGLLNRRGFIELATAEMQRFLRTGRTFSIVLADLDNFKKLNDQYGHAYGDYVLQEIARLLGERVRTTDSAGRWGGEEFMLLIPETESEGTALLAEKLRLSVENNHFQHGGQKALVTMTQGISTFRKGETLDSCIARADKALYLGKEQGRNQVQICV